MLSLLVREGMTEWLVAGRTLLYIHELCTEAGLASEGINDGTKGFKTATPVHVVSIDCATLEVEGTSELELAMGAGGAVVS